MHTEFDGMEAAYPLLSVAHVEGTQAFPLILYPDLHPVSFLRLKLVTQEEHVPLAGH